MIREMAAMLDEGKVFYIINATLEDLLLLNADLLGIINETPDFRIKDQGFQRTVFSHCISQYRFGKYTDGAYRLVRKQSDLLTGERPIGEDHFWTEVFCLRVFDMYAPIDWDPDYGPPLFRVEFRYDSRDPAARSIGSRLAEEYQAIDLLFRMR